MKRRVFNLSFATSLIATHAISARAQGSFPSKPVKIVVPYAAGGGPDVLTRKAAPRLAEILGQNVVVENILINLL